MAKRGIIGRQDLKEENIRPIKIKKYPYLFLIACEDGVTEPNYFEYFKSLFPEETVFLKAVGTGQSTLNVVQVAIKEKE